MVVRHGSIFDRPDKLKPTAMAAVADRRMADASALLKLGNKHANGAVYLAGFVIEILLKARLLDKHPRLNTSDTSKIADEDRRMWSLIWRQHDLAPILDQLDELRNALIQRGLRANRHYLDDLRALCSRWTIQPRYSPHTIDISEARKILARVRSVKELLK